MESDITSIINNLSSNYKGFTFSFNKKNFTNKNVYEFIFSSEYYNGSVMFDLNILEKSETPIEEVISNSIDAFIKRKKREEAEENGDEEGAKIKSVWSKGKKKTSK